MTHVVRVGFRTGGGRRIGLGHVRRCLSLALALRNLGAQSLFLLDGDPDVFELVAAAGHETMHIRTGHDMEDTVSQCRDSNVDVLVADSYALSTSYLRTLGEAARVVVVLDDLADRELPVTLVVNGSAGAGQLRYRGSPETTYLLGPQYILLRPEFAVVPTRTIAERIDRVLITVGGSDPTNLTVRLMQWIARAVGSVKQDVVVGPLFENLEALQSESKAAGSPIVLHKDPADMRGLMLAADLALCGGGQTTYELAATGTPAIAIRTAENQTVNLEGLSAAGSLVWSGDVNDDNLEAKVTRELKTLADDASRRAVMSRQGRTLVDGQGAARVAKSILSLVGDCAA
jgi:UDP-2,4-diacetamido-2,4,6-trideoxy-beta-L-altropyranose hydrolase